MCLFLFYWEVSVSLSAKCWNISRLGWMIHFCMCRQAGVWNNVLPLHLAESLSILCKYRSLQTKLPVWTVVQWKIRFSFNIEHTPYKLPVFSKEFFCLHLILFCTINVQFKSVRPSLFIMCPFVSVSLCRRSWLVWNMSHPSNLYFTYTSILQYLTVK